MARTTKRRVPSEGEASTFDSDLEWFRQHSHELLPIYEGRYVAVLRGEVVDSDDSFEGLAERVYGKYGYREILMKKVEANPRPFRIPSVRLVKS